MFVELLTIFDLIFALIFPFFQSIFNFLMNHPTIYFTISLSYFSIPSLSDSNAISLGTMRDFSQLQRQFA